MQLILALNPDITSPLPTSRVNVIEKIIAEREYQQKTWGTEFDDNNTLNDWVTYAVIYLGRAASMKATPVEQYSGVLKAATLLVGALEAAERNDGFAPRHYDPENPEMTEPLDLSRVRAISDANVTE
jgi:hypothetical protein